jgi:hypothetical protein
MRKIGAAIAITAFAAVIASPPPATAFGLNIGPFHFHVPFWRGHHRLYMRGRPTDMARPESGLGLSSALLYPSVALPGIFAGVFTPANASPWPFEYQAIFATAFAKAPPAQDARLCQPSVDSNAIVGRIRAEVTPTDDQMQLLQRLGGAMGAASGFLAKSCPNEIPAQPVARLQLMESQIEELAMAVDMVRQPLQDFAQSLDADQQKRFAPAATSTDDRRNRPDAVAAACGISPSAVDWSIDQIDQTVQTTDAQRAALNDVRQAFGKAATDLEAHCPTKQPATALGRLDMIEGRLDSTWRAALSIQVALANFETKLTAEQKDRFEAMNFIAAR